MVQLSGWKEALRKWTSVNVKAETPVGSCFYKNSHSDAGI